MDGGDTIISPPKTGDDFFRYLQRARAEEGNSINFKGGGGGGGGSASRS